MFLKLSGRKRLNDLPIRKNNGFAFLENFNESQFDKIYPSNKMTYYEHIHGILQHDAYHLGQIVLLSKLDFMKNVYL